MCWTKLKEGRLDVPEGGIPRCRVTPAKTIFVVILSFEGTLMYEFTNIIIVTKTVNKQNL